MNQLGGTTKKMGHRRRQRHHRWLIGCLLAASAMIAGACTTGNEIQTESSRVAEAEQSLLAAGHDEDVVLCTINVARPRLKRGPLSDLALDELLHSCDEARRVLAGQPDEADEPERLAVTGPTDLGDDQKLDGLWRQCEAGDGDACDALFQESPTGSAYEQFGVSCGQRPEILNCGDLNEPEEALSD